MYVKQTPQLRQCSGDMSDGSSWKNMSVNSSSPMPLAAVMTMCFQYASTFFSFTFFAIANIVLLLPLFAVTLCLGRQRSASATSHSDVFTYHMVAIETVGLAGCVCFCCGAFASAVQVMALGVYFFSVTASGQASIHVLTCVERHLAVVHPVAYVGLRSGVRVRNAAIGCSWLLFLASFGPMHVGMEFILYEMLLLSALSIVAISLCSLSVLCALIRPGPGSPAGDRAKVRAFHTIAAIWGALLFRFGGHLCVIAMYSSPLSQSLRCGALMSGVWFCLPSSLVLPLLFLHRAGKLPCCKGKTRQQSRPRAVKASHSD